MVKAGSSVGLSHRYFGTLFYILSLLRPSPAPSLLKRFQSSKNYRASVLNHFNHVQLFETQWTVACQVPLSMGFSRQGYWSGLPFPSPGDLPDPGMEPESLKVSCTGRQVLYR